MSKKPSRNHEIKTLRKWLSVIRERLRGTPNEEIAKLVGYTLTSLKDLYVETDFKKYYAEALAEYMKLGVRGAAKDAHTRPYQNIKDPDDLDAYRKGLDSAVRDA